MAEDNIAKSVGSPLASAPLEKTKKKTTSKNITPKVEEPKEDLDELYPEEIVRDEPETITILKDDAEAMFNLIKNLTPIAVNCISVGNANSLDNEIKSVLTEYKKKILKK